MPLEQIRTFLIIALLGVLFLMWQAWQQDYGSRPQLQRPAKTAEEVEHAPTAARPDIPHTPKPTQAEVPSPASSRSELLPADQRIHVHTDVVDVEIDPAGGDLRRLGLLKYPVSLADRHTPFLLLNDTPSDLFIAQSGLLGAGSHAAPNHYTTFTPEKTNYVLGDETDKLDVNLHWDSPDGLRVTKTYTFRRNSYVVELTYHVENTSAAPWAGRLYGQFQRAEPPQRRGLGFVYTYTGGVLSTPEKPYEKIDFSDMTQQNLNEAVKGGWAAMIQHYFAGAWVPDQDVINHYYTRVLDGPRYVIGVISPEQAVAPGQAGLLKLKIYVGPKIQQRMEQVAPGLERTVDYGWLFFIAQPLHWVLAFLHGVVGNWGWSIILLTLLIKLAFFHLSATSYKSMARMRKMQPRIMTLRERYASDKARMQQAMLELYKTEKINPLGGCLPILVQIPVFIALYWVLLESVELRQAPFIFWISDLSTKDPYFVLPILMGVTMFVQQKLNPTPPDPIQAKVMMALPVVFTFFFLFFPSGLVLYWFVNNLLSIAQQWVITKRVEAHAT